MKFKALLALAALLLAAGCTADLTGPSTSRAPSVERANGGPGTYGSGG